jgi:hypothetical protein
MIKKIDLRCYFLLGLMLIGGFLSSFSQETARKIFMQNPTIADSFNQTQTESLRYRDSLSSDNIYLRRSDTQIPLYYFKNVKSEVCFDNECRLLDIRVYWNITGRYLGFEIPKGEFLSKYDHEPFTEIEYRRLNELLANPSLPFGNMSFDELVAVSEKEASEVDGVSGATSEKVSEIVVKGAAYTTFKLWNIVYGPTMDFVAHLTESQLNADLIDWILKSSDINDRLWALDKIDQNMTLNSKLIASLSAIVSNENYYYMVYSTIRTLEPVHLDSDDLQLGLFSAYKTVNHSIKKMIVEKLIQAPYLNVEIVKRSRSLLVELNGQQLDGFLKLYTKHGINDQETCMEISKILQNENNYVSQKAYEFLSAAKTEDPFILESLKAYKKENF